MRKNFFLAILLTVFIVSVSASFADNQFKIDPNTIRLEHPRLFLNKEMLPEIRDRALKEENPRFLLIKQEMDALQGKLSDANAEQKDFGVQAAKAAFVFLMTEEEKYLTLAKRCLAISIRYYETCYAQKKAVSWFCSSRLHAVIAWDWLYNRLSDSERKEYMARMTNAIDNVLTANPPIPRENRNSYTSGFYGVKNLLWYVGLTVFKTDAETELTGQWLREGYDDNMRMLEYRQKAAGDDGGAISTTVTYSFGAYPWAGYNFLYTYYSGTGRNIAGDWPYIGMLGNYILWNWIPIKSEPCHYGNGDVTHTNNHIIGAGETGTECIKDHLSNILYFYGQNLPEYAALTEYLQNKLPDIDSSRTNNWFFFYPFLRSRIENSQTQFNPEKLPPARHFEEQGQVFMHSGLGEEDTYALFTCGGSFAQHRHYDNLNFIIYHKGYLALDSGTRWQSNLNVNMDHLVNYFAQTVAHNCIVIHQQGEPNVPFWGLPATANHGGQHKILGSLLKGFEVHDNFVYVAGDATECYRQGPDAVKRPAGSHDTNPPVLSNDNLPDKAELVTRQMVFIPPYHFVIFDRVKTTDASYKKDWLIHTANQPQITDNVIKADHMDGRMFCKTLLPLNAKLTLVGGEGKEFWAVGRNWALEEEKDLSEESKALMGRWRVEVTPANANKEDIFLHVIQVGGQTVGKMDDVELLQSDEFSGVHFKAGNNIWTVKFNNTGELGGTIRCANEDFILVNQKLANTVQKQSGITANYNQMTYKEAVARISSRKLPDFWIADNNQLADFIAGIKTGKVTKINQTDSGRPIYLVEYGEPEPVEKLANFGSAVAAQEPFAYMNKDSRKKPVIFFIGPVHSHEVEGLVGLVNFMNVIETGKDLRGNDQTHLKELAEKCRILIIPSGNPDGLARFTPKSLLGMGRQDIKFWGQGTRRDDTLFGWLPSKAVSPMKKSDYNFLGCYFDDAGVNAMHDDFFSQKGRASAAILNIAQQEGPDITVSLHSFANSPEFLRPAWTPVDIQTEIRNLAESFNGLCDERKLPHTRKLFEATPEDGKGFVSFNLVSVLYHTSGTSAFVFESPHGVTDGCEVSFDELLDIQLTLYESMLRHACLKKNF